MPFGKPGGYGSGGMGFGGPGQEEIEISNQLRGLSPRGRQGGNELNGMDQFRQQVLRNQLEQARNNTGSIPMGFGGMGGVGPGRGGGLPGWGVGPGGPGRGGGLPGWGVGPGGPGRMPGLPGTGLPGFGPGRGSRGMDLLSMLQGLGMGNSMMNNPYAMPTQY